MSKLYLFTLQGCAPCNQVKPLFLKEVIAQKRDYEIVDVMENMDRARKLGVTAAPTLVVDDKIVAVGPQSIMAYVGAA